MEVILTHENADFDAIASLVGASKLFPAATPVLPRRVNRNGRAFIALYGAELPLVEHEDLPRRRKITRAILVDTQGLTMLKGMVRDLQVDVIDHHERAPDLSPHWAFCGDQVGATTTLLVEELSARSLKLTGVEATMLLLGIYEDTGSLLFAATTPRDARAAAWLLEQGAHLDVVNKFLHHPLAPQQRELYDCLVEQAETHVIEGHRIVITWAEAPDFDEEISTLAHKLRDLLEPSALFVLVGLDKRIQLVARSTTDDIDVAAVAARFDGGGHKRASAALIRGSSLEAVRHELLQMLPEIAQPRVTVAQIMSRGVQVLTSRETVAAAAERMRRTGHEGYPVVVAGHVVGLLNRRAVDRALQFGMADAPVTQVMKAGNVTIDSDDSVAHLQQLMIESGWGQIPVVAHDRIVGVVTRTDLITLWGTSPHALQHREVVALLEEALSPSVLALVRRISELAHTMGHVPYFVGGLVRDLLLGQAIVDVDMVIEGDAIALARQLASSFGGRVTAHKRFGTAKWLLSRRVWQQVIGDAARDKLPPSIDFATARTEFYIDPAALPQVERSSIKQDLHRRDFTINTLAICLNPDHWGELYDFYGGEADLQSGIIRVLHSLSFVDDPTRILRAARLESRLQFHLDPRSEELIANALPQLKNVSGDRIRHELEQISDEPEPEQVLHRLDTLGVLETIHPALRCDGWLRARYGAVRYDLDTQVWGLAPKDKHYIYLALLAYRMDVEELGQLVKRLKIKRSDADDLSLQRGLRDVLPRLSRLRRPSSIYRLLEPCPARVLAAAWIATERKRAREHLLRYQTEWCMVETELGGEDLKTSGLAPGPLFGRLLEGLRDARLDGKVGTREEEQALLDKLLAKRKKGTTNQ